MRPSPARVVQAEQIPGLRMGGRARLQDAFELKSLL